MRMHEIFGALQMQLWQRHWNRGCYTVGVLQHSRDIYLHVELSRLMASFVQQNSIRLGGLNMNGLWFIRKVTKRNSRQRSSQIFINAFRHFSRLYCVTRKSLRGRKLRRFFVHWPCFVSRLLCSLVAILKERRADKLHARQIDSFYSLLMDPTPGPLKCRNLMNKSDFTTDCDALSIDSTFHFTFYWLFFDSQKSFVSISH